MITPRTIEEIQQDYFTALIQSGSGLIVDKVEGSLAYTLSRASSVIAAQQDFRLQESQLNTSILNARGSFLDVIGSSFLLRTQAKEAKGFVMAQSREASEIIPPLTRFIYLDNGLEFYTTNTSATPIYSFLETVLPVTALNPGVSSNLVSGTRLFAPDFPDTRFIVGSTRSDTYYGDLNGGQDEESDLSYQTRLIAYLSRSSSSTKSTIEARLLTYPLIDKVFVQTRTAGIVEIWVDSDLVYTEAQRNEILEFIRPDIAMGIIPIIIQARRKIVDIHLDMRPYGGQQGDLNNLTQRVKTIISATINALSIGDTLSPNILEGLISPLVRSLKIVTPTEDVSSASDEIIVLGDLKVTYPASSTWSQNI